MPLALVTAIAVSPLAKVPLGPLPGAENVTLTPETGLFEFVTVAWSIVANAVFTVVFWLLPAVTVTVAAAGGLFVKLKLAGVATPATLAVTVYDPAVPFAVNGAATIP